MDSSISVRRRGNLAVRIDQDGRSLAVRPVGELDIASAQALEDSLRHALESGASSVVLARVIDEARAGVRRDRDDWFRAHSDPPYLVSASSRSASRRPASSVSINVEILQPMI